ncbi:6285_t:CDS:2, partial [Acaulospora colombiana]
LHLGRKPGNVRFTSLEGRDDFARIVLYDIRPPAYARQLADRMIKKMDHLNGGRSWLSAHMRRGDCAYPFPPTDFLALLLTIRQLHVLVGQWKRLSKGPQYTRAYPFALTKDLRRSRCSSQYGAFLKKTSSPGRLVTVTLGLTILGSIYLATDERDDQAIRYLGENGA